MKTARIKAASPLTIGFGLSCAFLAATIALSLSEQAKLNAVTATMGDDRWPKIELAGDVRLLASDIAVSLRNLMLSGDAAVRRHQIAAIKRYRDDAAASIAALERRVVTPSGREALARVRVAWQEYVNGQRQLIALELAGRDEEAKDYLNTHLKPMLQACRDALASQIGNELDLTNRARGEAAQAYAATLLKMLGLGLVARAVDRIKIAPGRRPASPATLKLAHARPDHRQRVPV